MSAFLQVVKLDNLQEDEFKRVIRKLSSDAGKADQLIAQIEARKAEIYPLLFTPLLVTLLMISYKSFQELPNQLSDFYDSLFQVLLKRHDGTKPGYVRERKCLINDKQFRDCFDAISYESKCARRPSFDYKEIYGYAEKAIKRVGIDVDAQAFIDDIVKVTCLVIRDGEEHRFIHKSVQEYFSAAFLSSRPDAVFEVFWGKIIECGRYTSWRQEAQFLSEIDGFRFRKYVKLPLLRYQLMLEGGEALSKPRMNIKKVGKFADQFVMTLALKAENEYVISQLASTERISTSGGVLFHLLSKRTWTREQLGGCSLDFESDNLRIAGSRLAEKRFIRDELRATLQIIINDSYEAACALEKSIKKEEREDLLDSHYDLIL